MKTYSKSKQEKRTASLMPNGVPRYIRCYDNNKDSERYTVVFTGQYRNTTNGLLHYLIMSENPVLGTNRTGYSQTLIDDPAYGHLGRKIKFEELPKECQNIVKEHYKEIWNIASERVLA